MTHWSWSSRKPTEVQWRFTEEGEKVRVSLRTGRIIPKPVVERRDGIVPQQWKGVCVLLYLCILHTFVQVFSFCMLQVNFSAISDGPKDTSPEDTLERTYAPSLKTLEEEVMEKLGIQENRRHRRSYWYWPENADTSHIPGSNSCLLVAQEVLRKAHFGGTQLNDVWKRMTSASHRLKNAGANPCYWRKPWGRETDGLMDLKPGCLLTGFSFIVLYWSWHHGFYHFCFFWGYE